MHQQRMRQDDLGLLSSAMISTIVFYRLIANRKQLLTQNLIQTAVCYFLLNLRIWEV